jgi:predicted naringenin-chalcone synthase
MTSLYVAKQLIEADTTGRAVVLVACAEVCSVHISSEPKAELGVGNSIFGDGAASAIVTHAGFRGSRGGAVDTAPTPYPLETPEWEWCIDTMSSEIIADSAGHMTWKQSVDGGRYDMWLAREIPEALLSFFVKNGISLLRKVNLNPYGCAWALHPGGKGILTNFEKGLATLGIKPEGIECSHDVLANHGNMSSATILFVLQRVLSSTKRDSAFFAGELAALSCLAPPFLLFF